MSFRHTLASFFFVALFVGGIFAVPALAQMEGAPAMTAPPPQQMPAYGAPAYETPAAYPSTSDPAAAPTAPAVPYASGASPDVNLGATDPGPIYTPYGSPEAMTASLAAASDGQAERLMNSNEPWQWQLAPTGLMYKSYLAGNREPRMSAELMHERTRGWFWDATVGGRVGILRYGTDNSLWPQGWQLDVEGAAFPRLDLEHNEDLTSVDFRGGLLSTARLGPIETKFGYYHLSSHLGDEYMMQYPDSLNTRINYVRDSLIGGAAVYLNPSLRLYTEVGWTFHEDGGAKPWEIQFGADFSSPEPTGIAGSPFFAINAHLRQENNFGGNLSVQTGWQWRGREGHLVRVGMQYFNGLSDQYQFYNTFEENLGFGLWYDY
jgi:hypothetical protein